MGDKTGISWTDATWNPVRGCSRVSEGCRNCYAEQQAARIVRMAKGKPTAYDELVRMTAGGDARWTGKVALDPKALALPLGWKSPRRVFVNSMSDLFHEKLTNEQIAAVFGVMAASPRHTFQVLTKRARRMREWFEWAAQRPKDSEAWHQAALECSRRAFDVLEWHPALADENTDASRVWPLANVWLGVSVENQEAADERIPELLKTPAAVRFLSCEPLIGSVDLRGVERGNTWSGGDWLRTYRFQHEHDDGRVDVIEERNERIDWVIAGCESGPGARKCSVEWLRSLRDQCKAAGVAFFLKQANELPQPLGSREPFFTIGARDGSKRKPGGVIELPYLDGVQHAAFPVP